MPILSRCSTDAGCRLRTPRVPSPRCQRTTRLLAAIVALISATALLAGCDSSTPTVQPASHAGEPAHGNGPEHVDAGIVRLDPAELAALDVATSVAGPGTIKLTATFPGAVGINQERHAHVVARVAGVATTVAASVGEQVEVGETLAILESRDLAAATATYLGAREQTTLARDQFERMDKLYEQGIATASEHLKARQTFTEAQIRVQGARHALLALGLSASWVDQLPGAADSTRFRYPLTAPISGSVIQRHLTRGEAVEADSETFEIADLSQVWVDLDIFQEDMAKVREGQVVTVSAGDLSAQGRISYVRPIIGDTTRTALARVVLPNPEGRWKPGMFVSGIVALDQVQAPVVVAKAALQTLTEQTVVFVKTDQGFRAQPVTLGAKDADQVEVSAGLEPGDTYVSQGAFTLKAELAKGSFESGHSH